MPCNLHTGKVDSCRMPSALCLVPLWITLIIRKPVSECYWWTAAQPSTLLYQIISPLNSRALALGPPFATGICTFRPADLSVKFGHKFPLHCPLTLVLLNIVCRVPSLFLVNPWLSWLSTLPLRSLFADDNSPVGWMNIQRWGRNEIRNIVSWYQNNSS